MTYTITDDCGNDVTKQTTFTIVDTTPPTFTVPGPITVSCDDDKTPATTGDVNDEDDVCSNDLDATYMDVEDYDQCGGTITRTWKLIDDCGNETEKVQIITVDPAPEPEIIEPETPSRLTCDEAVNYLAPTADYSNGLSGRCEIRGTVDPQIDKDFTVCGGEIRITWTIPADENCDRPGDVVTAVIDVLPAPDPEIELPSLPSSLTCEEADSYNAPNATYSNNASFDECSISGTTPGSILRDFDQCGGHITITWTVATGCDNNAVERVARIPVTPATPPTIDVPQTPPTLTCDEAANYSAPNATYSNGQNGTCSISGTLQPQVQENFTICGGTITITWTIDPEDYCDRPAIRETRTIDVLPAPNPEIELPSLPPSLTCEEADNYNPPNATYSNNATYDECLISGTTPESVSEDYDKCGGTITITWTVSTGCDNGSVQRTATIPVTPAAPPTIDVPQTPPSLTCDEAADYTAPNANYSNGQGGNCGISGTVPAQVVEDFTICGGTITITWTIDPADNCGRPAITETRTIDVLPAPNPEIELPELPSSLTCEEAGNYTAPDATYSNNATYDECTISGTTPGSVQRDFDQCGGEVIISWTVSTGCDNNAVERTARIPVLPAPSPEIDLPQIPATLTCEEAALYVAPNANYDNGALGECRIAGSVSPSVVENFDKCGGTIAIAWTIAPDDNCGRTGVTLNALIQVLPAPDPEITVPQLPASLTCEEAENYQAPSADYSNNANSNECLIEGTVPGSVTENFNECGGSITITWTAPTGCNNGSVTRTATIPVTPAAPPSINVPQIPSSLTCDEAATYTAPSASYSNGVNGTCAINGTVPPVVQEDFTICGGTITITWTIEPEDNCGRAAISETRTIDVLPAPAPEIVLPSLPSSLTCEEADNYNAPNATYSNNARTDECSISGTTPGVIVEDYDECGGSITITWTVSTGCDNGSVQRSATIPVTPAAPPTINVPQTPSSLTCDEAANYSAPNASYGNGQNGTCSISGTLSPQVVEDFTICGGTITITWTIEPEDNCGRPAISETRTIDVLPAPAPEIQLPSLPQSLTCEEAANYSAPNASYSNNARSEECLITGSTPGVIMEDYDQCGGTITITWTVSTGCDNNSAQRSATIPVTPATPPTINVPQIPASLTCDEAANYSAPNATYSNGQSGTCGISGTLSPRVDEDFTICGGTITITWTIDPGDNCGRPAIIETRTIDVLPAPVPEIQLPSLPASLTCEEADSYSAPNASYSNNANTNECLISGTTPGVVMEDFDQCGGSITITWTVSTGCDNGSVQRTASIPVTPATPPSINVPQTPSSLTCDEAASYTAPSASYSNGRGGSCGISGSVPPQVEEDFTICGGTITITWTIEPADNCGRPAITETRTIDVLPAPAPEIQLPNLPSSLTCEEADNFSAPNASYSNNARADECSISGTTPGVVSDDYDRCGGSLTITWTVATGCDNGSVQRSVTIPVTPATPPTISVPQTPLSLTCDEAASYSAPNASYSNGQNGNCGISGSLPPSVQENFTICGGTITITWTIDPADNCGRPAITETRTIDVLPAPAPEIQLPSLPASLTCEEADSYSVPNATYSNSARADECLISGTTPGSIMRDYDQCGGSITITWTVSTGCDNGSVQRTATIPVTPAAPPTINVPQTPTSLTCDEAANYTAPNASYNNGQSGTCGISGTVTPSVEENFTICGGTITIRWTVDPADNCGRPAITETRTIDVLPAPAPTISIPSLPVRLSCEEVGSFSAPQASYNNGANNDECSISGTVLGIISDDYSTCGGSITITWTVGTGCNNESVQESVTIPVDGPDAPSISCPQPLTLDCDDPQRESKIAAWLASATAQADCGASVSISNDYDQTSFVGGCSPSTGTKIVTFTATDECGGTDICTARIEIVDNNDPEWNIDPQPLTLECSDPDLDRKVQDWINSQGGGQANDACSSVGYQSDFRGFDRNCDGVTNVEFTAVDDCGNRATRSTTITIIDATKPQILDIAPDITVDCGESYEFSNPRVSDNCDTNVGLTFEDLGTSNACTGGVIIRTWTATDECGNVETAEQRVTISADNAAPIFTSSLPQDVSVTCGNIPSAPIVEADDCNGATVTLTESDPVVRVCGYRITRTWTATDACGNSISHVQTIDVDCPLEATVDASGSVNCADPDGGSATVTVTQGQAPFTYLWDNGEITATATSLDNGPHTVTVTDASACQIILNVTIEGDFTPPTVSASGGELTCINTSISLNASTNGVIVGWTGPNGFNSNQASPSVSVAGVYTVTVEAANGCTATATATVTEDKDAPVVTAGGGTLTCLNATVTLNVATSVRLSDGQDRMGSAHLWQHHLLAFREHIL